MQQSVVDNKRVAKNAVTLYFRMLFQMAVYLYTSRVVIQVLGLSDFGIYDVVGGVVGILVFLNNSMVGCTQRFITFAIGKGDNDYLKKVYSASLSIHIGMALLVLLLGETVGLWYVENFLELPMGRHEEAMVVYHCSLLASMLMIVNVPYNATIIAYERMTAFAVITILDVLLKLSIVLALPHLFGYDLLILYAILLLIESLIMRIVYGAYCHLTFKNLYFVWVRDKALYKEMVFFAGWSTFGNFALVCNTQGLNLVLNGVGGTLLNAARGTAFQVQTAVTAFTASFQTAVNPQITKSYAAGNVDAMNQLILRSSKFSFFLLCFLAIPLGVEMETVLNLWLTDVPEYAVVFTRLLLCVSLVDAIANPMMIGAAATGRIKKYHLIIGITLFSALPLAALVSHITKRPESVFETQLFIVVLTQCIRMHLCKDLYRFSLKNFIRYVLYPILRVCPLALLVTYVAHHHLTGGFMGVFFVVAVSTIVLASLIYVLGLTKGERDFILSKIKRK